MTTDPVVSGCGKVEATEPVSWFCDLDFIQKSKTAGKFNCMKACESIKCTVDQQKHCESMSIGLRVNQCQ